MYNNVQSRVQDLETFSGVTFLGGAGWGWGWLKFLTYPALRLQCVFLHSEFMLNQCQMCYSVLNDKLTLYNIRSRQKYVLCASG